MKCLSLRRISLASPRYQLIEKFSRISQRLQHSNEKNDIKNNNNTKKDEFEWTKPQGRFSAINIYNTAAQRKVPLVLKHNAYATWYTCGPTVYDSTHLGHASCYVKLDIVQRILRDYFKYNLITAMNITDIDDKIIRRSQESGRDWRELARGYEAEFWSDLQKLNVESPNIKLRVTDYVPNIIKFIQRLIDTEQAYVTNDKSVYFNVSKLKYYGKLQKLNLDAQLTTAKPNEKLSAADFALWKSKPSNEPSWKAPWGGTGRPGWHIECSTLATLLFGNKIDFHAGGLDLRFPHHENEEAQSCAYHETNQWVNYWLHTGQLSVKGDQNKMSKSLLNTISVSEMLDHYTADEFRMACLLSNYRNAMPYSSELMETARQTLHKFRSFSADCDAYMSGKKPWLQLDNSIMMQQLLYSTEQLNDSLSDDFDTARAISVLIDQCSSISRIINSKQGTHEENTLITAAPCLDVFAAMHCFVLRALRVFGMTSIKSTASVGLAEVSIQTTEISKQPAVGLNFNDMVEDLLQLRRNIRTSATASPENKMELYKICDDLRNVLRNHGIEVRDHGQQSSWTFDEARLKKSES